MSGGVRGCFYCLSGGGGMSSLLFLPHPGISPAQSAERVWLKRGSDAKGQSFWLASLREAGSCVEASKREKKRRFRKKG